jgi:hypothetical protein
VFKRVPTTSACNPTFDLPGRYQCRPRVVDSAVPDATADCFYYRHCHPFWEVALPSYPESGRARGPAPTGYKRRNR